MTGYKGAMFMSRHPTWLLLPVAVLILAFFLSPSSPLARSLPSLTKIRSYSSLFSRPSQPAAITKPAQPSSKMPKAPVYFFSHGGVSTSPPPLDP